MDYRYYCRLLRRYKKRLEMNIFGFCLMPDYVHLIVEPHQAQSLSLFMQGVHQSYTLYFNRKYRHRGSLWHGRFKSIALDRDQDLFDCIKYLEFHPVRANIATTPLEYPWSSCSLRILGYKNGLLDETAHKIKNKKFEILNTKF